MPVSSRPALAAFARMKAAHEAFVASYRTNRRGAAIVESRAADVAFIAAMPGCWVWVKAEWEKTGYAWGRVSMAFENGDVRTEHGVNAWGEFCPASFSLFEADAFFRSNEELSARASALDEKYENQPAGGVQTALLF